MRVFVLFLIVSFGARADAQSSEARVVQYGPSNEARIVQASSLIQVTQTGGLNLARADQSEGSEATLLQDGTGNVFAGFDPLTELGDSAAAALQSGGSILFLIQTGIDNRAFIQQDGGAAARITQNGSGNTVTLRQSMF